MGFQIKFGDERLEKTPLIPQNKTAGLGNQGRLFCAVLREINYACATTDTNDLSAFPFLKATTPSVKANSV